MVPNRAKPLLLGQGFTNDSEHWVRFIVAVDGGRVGYWNFGWPDGTAFGGPGYCSSTRFRQWASRELTKEEVARLDVAAMHTSVIEISEHRKRIALDTMEDEELIAELKARGLSVSVTAIDDSLPIPNES